MTAAAPPRPVAEVRGPSDRMACVPYGATLTAERCVQRQRALADPASPPATRRRLALCDGCADGSRVAAALRGETAPAVAIPVPSAARAAAATAAPRQPETAAAVATSETPGDVPPAAPVASIPTETETATPAAFWRVVRDHLSGAALVRFVDLLAVAARAVAAGDAPASGVVLLWERLRGTTDVATMRHLGDGLAHEAAWFASRRAAPPPAPAPSIPAADAAAETPGTPASDRFDEDLDDVRTDAQRELAVTPAAVARRCGLVDAAAAVALLEALIVDGLVRRATDGWFIYVDQPGEYPPRKKYARDMRVVLAWLAQPTSPAAAGVGDVVAAQVVCLHTGLGAGQVALYALNALRQRALVRLRPDERWEIAPRGREVLACNGGFEATLGDRARPRGVFLPGRVPAPRSVRAPRYVRPAARTRGP